jgi:putative transposase
MFEDEAGFGRISEPANCWAPPKKRPSVPSQKVREYRTVYGAVSPIDGETFYLILGSSDSGSMSLFLKMLSERFPNDLILLCLDNASNHTANDMKIPPNIKLFFLPPRTPEMNLVEILWREIRKDGFKNKAFETIDAVMDKFCDVIQNMSKERVISVTLWKWIEDIVIAFNA